jgi:hypothetical protein
MRELGRRDFLKALAAFSGVMAARPFASLASPLGGRRPSRLSRLSVSQGLTLVHTDLHNHSLVSGDAFGNPLTALQAMKDGGIDVACLTEHAIMGKGHGELTCPGWQEGGCHKVEGINDSDWDAMADIADAGDALEGFVAFRGFEFSSPTVGHLNVWFSEKYTDPLHERALVTPRAISQVDQVFPQSQPVVDQFENAPDIATIMPFYDWLASPPDREILGGGNDGIACFNHPGDFGDFEAWSFHPGAAARVTMIEAFNTNGYQYPDFFWYNADKGMPNPFNACLNAGWRVGFTGVSDEHSVTYAKAGGGRGGLWAASATREGVRAALAARRSFATLEPGLRLDATAKGAPMGSPVSHTSGAVTMEIDIDRGSAWTGKQLFVEVVGPGPSLIDAVEIHVPAPDDSPVQISVDVARAETPWLFLRFIDPLRLKDVRAPAGSAFEQHGGAFAYASPWFLDA